MLNSHVSQQTNVVTDVRKKKTKIILLRPCDWKNFGDFSLFIFLFSTLIIIMQNDGMNNETQWFLEKIKVIIEMYVNDMLKNCSYFFAKSTLNAWVTRGCSSRRRREFYKSINFNINLSRRHKNILCGMRYLLSSRIFVQVHTRKILEHERVKFSSVLKRFVHHAEKSRIFIFISLHFLYAQFYVECFFVKKTYITKLCNGEHDSRANFLQMNSS